MLAESARRYLGSRDGSTRLDDETLRDEIAQLDLDQLAFGLTMRRANEEARTQGPSAASSMFKLYMSELGKRRSEVWLRVLGTQALGWKAARSAQRSSARPVAGCAARGARLKAAPPRSSAT